MVTWRTYTLDGRTLVVERSPEGEWIARCGEAAEERRPDLAEAILAATGIDEVSPISPRTREAWVAWAREHAAWILAEAEQG